MRVTSSPGANDIRVLLLDDDEEDRRAVVRALSGTSVIMTVAPDFSSGLVYLDKRTFDCVLMDWYLPDGSAPELLRTVAGDRMAPPVVILTSTPDSEMGEEALRLGAQDYLSKGTLDRRTLQRSIRYAIERTRVARMKAQLAHASRMASVGQLAAGIAHELNNPAAVVLGMLGSIAALPIADPDVRSERDVLVAECDRAMQRIVSLVQPIRGFSRLSGRHVAAPVCLGQVVRDGIAFAAPSMRQRATLQIACNAVPELVGDHDALVGVVVNLLVNAQEAVDAAGGDSHVVRLTLSCLGDDGVTLSVEDSGRGVDPAMRERLFEPFFTHGKSGGTGLGLSICHDVVASHRGTIRISRSKLGGACFTVRLPIQNGLVPSREVESRRSRRGALSVLLVEDEPALRRVYSRLLRRHHVVAVSGGPAALAALAGQAFDVVLCDLMMPGMSGEEVYESAIRLGGAPPFVFMTGGASTPDVRAFIERVSAPILLKPFESDEVEAALATVAIAHLETA